MRMRLMMIGCLLSLGSLPAEAGNAWSAVRSPVAGAPQIIGSYASGCIAGAVSLPLLGEGYQVMRSSRHRYYGHPQLIQLIQRLGKQASYQGYRLLIGDLGQPRGGPAPTGHRSHQNGLDVDIWFLQAPADRVLSRSETERPDMPSVVRMTEGTVHPRWSSRQRDALKQVALAPEVERIFVNPIIKQELCATEAERSWLYKVRPWWGHDAHFHVRLACPADSEQCKPQKPLPPGDGCSPDLDNWVRDIVQAARFPKPWRKPAPPSEDRLPAACNAVLEHY